MLGARVIQATALLASISALARVPAALQRIPLAAHSPEPAWIYVRFVDVDTGAELAIDCARPARAGTRVERCFDADPAPDAWRVLWTYNERSGPAIRVDGYECMGTLPLTRARADPTTPFFVPLRATRQVKLWIEGDSGRSPAKRVRPWVPLVDRHERDNVEFETRTIRREPFAATDPVRGVGGGGRDIWSHAMAGCGMGAIDDGKVQPHVAFGPCPMDLWLVPEHANRDGIARHDHALPISDLPRYLGRYLEAGDDRKEVHVMLPPLTALCGRVSSARANSLAGASVQLCISEEPFATGPRNTIPDSPGTRVDVADDGAFEFPAIPPGPYWIGCVRGDEPSGPFRRIDVPNDGLRDVMVELDPRGFVAEPIWYVHRPSNLSDLFHPWFTLPDGDRGWTLTLVRAGENPDCEVHRLLSYNPFVPSASDWTSGHLVIRTRRDRIAVVDLAAAHAHSTDPKQWPVAWQDAARIWIVWNGEDRAAQFEVRSNGVLVERCWLEPGDVREVTVPPGESVVTTRPQRGEEREQRATLAVHAGWLVRER